MYCYRCSVLHYKTLKSEKAKEELKLTEMDKKLNLLNSGYLIGKTKASLIISRSPTVKILPAGTENSWSKTEPDNLRDDTKFTRLAILYYRWRYFVSSRSRLFAYSFRRFCLYGRRFGFSSETISSIIRLLNKKVLTSLP